MRNTLVILAFCLCGCEHTKRHVQETPKPKVTKTVTETTRTETPMPVYQTFTKTNSATRTITSDGQPAADLHKVEVKSKAIPGVTDIPPGTKN